MTILPGPGIAGNTISKGEFVDILTIETSSIASHYPYLLQSNISDAVDRLRIRTLWQVDTLFSAGASAHKQICFAAVRPCVPVTPQSGHSRTLHKMTEDVRVSFAELDNSIRCVPVLQDYTSSTSTDSSYFIPFTRKAGFPPRQR